MASQSENPREYLLTQIVEVWLWVLFMSAYLFVFGLFFDDLLAWKTVLGFWVVCNTIGFFWLRSIAHDVNDEKQETPRSEIGEPKPDRPPPTSVEPRPTSQGCVLAPAAVLVWLCLMALGVGIVASQLSETEPPAGSGIWSTLAASWQSSDILKIYIISGTLLLGDFLCYLFVPTAREMIDRFVYGPFYRTSGEAGQVQDGEP